MNRFEKARVLHSAGFYIGPRDPNRSTMFTGEWMVCADAHYAYPTKHAGAGGYCIVGNDLDSLIEAAFLYNFEERA